MTAIEEYQQELVRKEYMDRQHDDLAEAVATLESSIAKIDRETRQQYLATFAAVNGHFQEMFPKLTGGGTARLEIDGHLSGECRHKSDRHDLKENVSTTYRPYPAVKRL